jgi:hypothetical protein
MTTGPCELSILEELSLHTAISRRYTANSTSMIVHRQAPQRLL